MIRLLSFLFLALFGVSLVAGDLALAAPPGKWQTTPLKVTVVQGQAKTVKKFYLANKEILKPRLSLSANIKKMVKLDYKKLATLKAKKKLFFSVKLAPNVELKPKVYRGTLMLTGTVKKKSAELEAGTIIAGEVDNRAKVLARLPIVITVASDGRTTIVVSVVEEDQTTPIGAGVSVLVDGNVIGTTDANGRHVNRIPSGAHTISALQPFLGAGSTTVDLTGIKTAAKVVVTGNGIGEVYPHTFEFLSGSVVPSTATALSMRFVSPAQATLAPVDIQSAIVSTTKGVFIADLADVLAIQPDGVVTLTDLPVLGSVLASEAEMQIEVAAGGPNGSLYTGSAVFRIGRYSVTGKVTAPPSTPGLNVAGLPVTLTLLGTTYGGTAVSGADGSFAFPNIPLGNISLAVETVQNDVNYSGVGTLFAEASYTVLLRPLAVADLTNGVVALEIVPSTTAAKASASVVPARPAVAVPSIPSLSTGKGMSGKKATSSLAQAVSTNKDKVNIGYAVLDLPAGTPQVTLTYKTDTIEYPVYVLSQSRYNDVWSVHVFGPKGPLMPSIVRNVNSQLYIEPYWIPQGSWGTTGNIVKTMDVSGLTANGPVQVVVAVTSMNVGDSAYPTTVQATLSTDGVLSAKINRFIDAVDGPDDVVSLARMPESNLNQKQIEVGLIVPPGFDWGSVTATVEILTSPNAASGVVIHDGPPLTISAATNAGTLTVPATFAAPATSPFETPPSSTVRYRVVVKGKVMGASQATYLATEATSALLTPLWRMPPNFPRFSVREAGGDDWSQYGTYQWLVTNQASIPPVNDISGEHGMTIPGNVVHVTHRRGTDIDTLQYWTLDTTTGKKNYKALHKLAETAVLKPATDPDGAAARASLTDAINAQRTGLGSLSSSSVTRFFVGRGAPTALSVPGTVLLKSGWLKSLLKTGAFTAANGTVIDLGIGTFANTKLSFDDGHNDHNHVSLNASALAKTN